MCWNCLRHALASTMHACLCEYASAGSSKLKMRMRKKVPQLQQGGEDLNLVELSASFRLPESGISLTCLTLCVLLFTCFSSKEHTIVITYFQIQQLVVKFQNVQFFVRFYQFRSSICLWVETTYRKEVACKRRKIPREFSQDNIKQAYNMKTGTTRLWPVSYVNHEKTTNYFQISGHKRRN